MGKPHCNRSIWTFFNYAGPELIKANSAISLTKQIKKPGPCFIKRRMLIRWFASHDFTTLAVKAGVHALLTSFLIPCFSVSFRGKFFLFSNIIAFRQAHWPNPDPELAEGSPPSTFGTLASGFIAFKPIPLRWVGCILTCNKSQRFISKYYWISLLNSKYHQRRLMP
jgi:hypothetical protein